MFGQKYDRFYIATGNGRAPFRLSAFDSALLNAGVGDMNLIKLSSILPPSCEWVKQMPARPGALIPVAYGCQAHEGVDFAPGRWISAAVAVAIPEDPTLAGLIMEHHGHFSTPESCEQQVREMCEWGMKQGRKREFREIISESASMEVRTIRGAGAVFAGVVLVAKE